MIYRDRKSVNRPEFLDSDEVRAELLHMAEFYLRPFEERAQETYSHNQKLLQHPKILEPLLKLFYNKCAFCESRISLEGSKESSGQAVVHRFRPLSHATDYGWNVEPKEWPDHYWWFAYTWENLYPACRECDESRGNYFPIMPETSRLTPPTRMHADINAFAQGRRASAAILARDLSFEEHCLLDPCRDLKEASTDQDLWDGKYIVFLQDAFAISSSQFDADRIDMRPDPAGNTIALYGLNRRGLLKMRMDGVRTVVGHFGSKGDLLVDNHQAEFWSNAKKSLFGLDRSISDAASLFHKSAIVNIIVSALHNNPVKHASPSLNVNNIIARLSNWSSTSASLAKIAQPNVARDSGPDAGHKNYVSVEHGPVLTAKIDSGQFNLYVSRGDEKGTVLARSMDSGDLIFEFSHGSQIKTFDFSSVKNQVAYAGLNGIARLRAMYEFQDDALARHDSSLTSITFDQAGLKVLSASANQAFIWDEKGKKQQQEYRSDYSIDDAIFLGDGDRILLSGILMPPEIRHVSSGTILLTLPVRGSSCTPSASTDGNKIITMDSHSAYCFETVSGNYFWQLEHGGSITSAAFCPAGEFENCIATSSQDGTIRISDPDGNYMFHMEHDGTLTDVDFSADGRKLHLTGRGRVVRIIDIAWLRQQRLPVEIQSSGAEPDTLDRRTQQQQQQQMQMSGPPQNTGTTETQEHIVSLKLQNFRSIPDMEIDFRPRSNPPISERGEKDWARMKILLGENGLGKSSILWAIAISLMGKEEYERLARLPQHHLSGRHLLRYKENEGSIKIQLSGNSPERVVSFRRSSDDEDLVHVSFNKAAERTSSTYLCAYSTARLLNEQKANEKLFDTEQALTRGIAWLKSLNHGDYAVFTHGLWTTVWKRYYLNHPEFDNSSEMTITERSGDDILYTDVRGQRKSLEELEEPLRTLTALALDVMQDRRPLIAERNLHGGLNIEHLFNPYRRLQNANEWLCSQSDQSVPTGGTSQDTSGFKAAEEVISSLLVFEQLINAIEEPDKNHKPGEMYIDNRKVMVRTSGEPMALTQLSDGYTSVISLACDILAGAVNHSKKTGSVQHTHLNQLQGIVLIDEIGNNLHPRWKMRIIEKLRLALPRMQFIVTTHEPLCLRGAGAGEVEVIYNAATESGRQEVARREDVPDPSRLSVDQLLTSQIFGLSSVLDPDTEDAFNRYYSRLSIELKKARDAASDGAEPDITKIVRELREHKDLKQIRDAFTGRSWREYRALQYLDAWIADRERQRREARQNGEHVDEDHPGKLPDEVKSLLNEIWNSASRGTT